MPSRLLSSIKISIISKKNPFVSKKQVPSWNPLFPLGKGPLEYSEWVVLLSLYVKNGENEVQIHFFVLPLRLIF